MLFFSSSLAASLLVYLWSRPSRRELLVTSLATVGMCALFGLSGGWPARLMLVLVYGSLAAFAASFVIAIGKQGASRVKLLEAMMLVPVLTLGTLPMLLLISWLTPDTFDYYLYASSNSFGIAPPDFTTAQFIGNHDVLRSLCEFTYINLPVGLTLVFLMLRSRSPGLARQMFRCCLWVATLGWLCYLLFPASGNLATFHQLYPQHPPQLSQVAISQHLDIDSPRNCLPSLHTAWVLVLYWFTRHLGLLIRCLAFLFAALTLVYVLVCGHYFMDIFATLPWVTAIYAWCLRTSGWRRISGEGFALYLVFLIYLRFGGPLYLASPIFSWAAVLLVSSWTAWRIRLLHRRPRLVQAAPRLLARAA